jgi:hypothetical protein
MESKEQLAVTEYLHLYLGCEGLANIVYGYKIQGVRCVLVGINTVEELLYVKCRDIYGNEWDDFRKISFSQFKLFLRPLSDMTEDEETEYTSLVDQWNFGFRRNMLGAALATKYLLSKRFDLFGLIKAGLAIDATTINNQNPLNQ